MSGGATLSTHVLDVARGRPAVGLRVTLGTRTVATDDSGRIADVGGGELNPGTYRLLFEIGAYYGDTQHLYETIAVEITLREPGHYHVPLLISPFSCSSYRGI